MPKIPNLKNLVNLTRFLGIIQVRYCRLKVGPRTFTRNEADRFFGREREARQLLARVISERLVLFYAQSGAGKSSLINTRLIPQLEEADFNVLPVARVSGEWLEDVSEVANIFAFNLMRSLDQSEADPNRFSQVSLSHFLANLTSADGQSYYYDADLALADDETGSGAEYDDKDNGDEYEADAHVLILDQFEEIVTSHTQHWAKRTDFFQQLNQAMLDDPQLWVVLTLREDYVAALEPYAGLLADRMRARFYMQRMVVKAALAAVEQMLAVVNDKPVLFDIDPLLQAVGQLLYRVEPALGQQFETAPTSYPNLAQHTTRLTKASEAELAPYASS